MSAIDAAARPRMWIGVVVALSAAACFSLANTAASIAEGGGSSPLTISAIGEKVLLASASMTSAIDRLERRGLVARRNCASDRRLRYVDLTDSGKAFIGEIFARHEIDLEEVTAALSEEERNTMYEGLKKIGRAAKAATTGSKEAKQEASA